MHTTGAERATTASGWTLPAETASRSSSTAGGIEGFNTQLTCAPKQGLVVVVLSNVNGSVPEAMSEQLLDVAMGKPVVLASERTPVPIAKDELKRLSAFTKSPLILPSPLR